MREGEYLVAYLDDIYVVTEKDRAREVYDLVTEAIRIHAGVEDDPQLA